MVNDKYNILIFKVDLNFLQITQFSRCSVFCNFEFSKFATNLILSFKTSIFVIKINWCVLPWFFLPKILQKSIENYNPICGPNGHLTMCKSKNQEITCRFLQKKHCFFNPEFICLIIIESKLAVLVIFKFNVYFWDVHYRKKHISCDDDLSGVNIRFENDYDGIYFLK